MQCHKFVTLYKINLLLVFIIKLNYSYRILTENSVPMVKKHPNQSNEGRN